MTTLREARDALHAIEQRRLEFLRRKGNGELVLRFTANSTATALVRAARDRVQLQPHRHAAILAARHRLPERAVFDALVNVVNDLLHALASRSFDPATVLEALPAAIPSRPPERPMLLDWRKGFFPHDVDNEWATAWRKANPEQAALEADYHRRLTAWRAQQGGRDDRR